MASKDALLAVQSDMNVLQDAVKAVQTAVDGLKSALEAEKKQGDVAATLLSTLEAGASSRVASVAPPTRG
jgi:hypothetical protein